MRRMVIGPAPKHARNRGREGGGGGGGCQGKGRKSQFVTIITAGLSDC